MRILLISNGQGEDLIACNLAQAIFRLEPGQHTLHAFPVVGNGMYYRNLNIPTLISNPTFPSQGFIRRPIDIAKDIQKGVIRHTLKQTGILRRHIHAMDLVIAVGDVLCLFLAGAMTRYPAEKTVFIPTAKSDHFMPHTNFECRLIRRWAKRVYPRDTLTATSLQKKNINAQFFGNPMMDNISRTNDQFAIPDHWGVIGILPGSRHESIPNLVFILSIIDIIHQLNPQIGFICAVSPQFDFARLESECATTRWKFNPRTRQLVHETGRLMLHFTHRLGDVLHHASAIIGLAGTANEQAVHYGRSVICFQGFGPQSTLLRFQEQRQLVGEGLTLIHPRDVHQIADKALELALSHKADPSQIPSTPQFISAEAIIQDIFSTLQLQH